jgi:hypothetical protein
MTAVIKLNKNGRIIQIYLRIFCDLIENISEALGKLKSINRKVHKDVTKDAKNYFC